MVLIGLLLASKSIFPQTTDSSQSLLWEIKGNGVFEPSYIFATIRVQDKQISRFDSIVMNKIKACQAFVMEVNTDAVSPFLLRSLVLMKENSLEKILSKSDYALVQKKYKEYTGLSLGVFAKMKPFFLYAQLMKAQLPKDSKESFDVHILNFAKKNDKKIVEMETFQHQVDAIDKVPLDIQCQMLLFGLKHPDIIKRNIESVLQAYLHKDLNTVFQLSTDSLLVPTSFMDHFFTERNFDLCESIISVLKQQSCFVIISAANLMGEKGIFQLLKAKGYSVTPMLTQP